MAYLPGQILKVKPGVKCDEHPDRPSVALLVGETDSFGSEFLNMCTECHEKHLAHKDDYLKEETVCDICNSKAFGCAPIRDPDEGTSGRVYYACTSCSITLLRREDYNEEDSGPEEWE